MSNLTYPTDAGISETYSTACHYSQCVILPTHVKLAGQGGWDASGKLEADEEKQVALAFENIERVLKTAGLKGWENVYSIRSYHINIDQSFQHVVKLLKEKFGSHRPVWTCVGVKALAFPDMLVEIEVEALKA
ncbi:YjgF-like protein [Pleomassaria siparia CBS 279.74]|uniref:YjgF-like protein n=1 Tax=Pleomassaria siparia CBS 279.74 TaxID=1314801 RepID=A0A6G1K0E7_9PLEO|nr:YjgF-like protein [Pleomassaria siparia CBS 279.74]